MPVVLVDTQGAQLEAEVHLPRPNEGHPQFSDTGVLLVHPFSKLGGSMHDYVIEELWR